VVPHGTIAPRGIVWDTAIANMDGTPNQSTDALAHAHRIGKRRKISLGPTTTLGKRKFDNYAGAPGVTSGSRKRSRSAGGYSRRKRSSAYGRRNIRTAGYVGIEKKFYDTSYSGAVVAPTDATGGEADPATVLTLSAPAQGDGEQNRDGKKIVAKYVEIKGVVQTAPVANQTVPPITPVVFIAVVLDTQTNAAQLNSEDVFKNQNGSAFLAPMPLRDLEYGVRFKILKQLRIVAEPFTVYDGTNLEVGGVHTPFECYIPLKDLVINFNSTATAGVASVLDNSIHVIAYTNDTTTTPTLRYQARLRFIG